MGMMSGSGAVIVVMVAVMLVMCGGMAVAGLRMLRRRRR